jgi:hydroxymethylpyrimidine/phosphomethylpyrimidine kinase
MKKYPTVLTIAGSDSGGGAGIQADLKTISALGAYGTTAITALTAQNTMGVRAIHPVPAAFVKMQLEAVFEDITVDAVKIGMINTVEIAEVIAEILERYRPGFVVFDPVMVSTTGARLIQRETVDNLWRSLFPRVDLITPNLDEGEMLVGRAITSTAEMIEVSEELLARGCKAVLLKGGHLIGPKVFDIFSCEGSDSQTIESEHIVTDNVHGTGCTLSSAIATFMALRNTLFDAILHSKQYISNAISAGRHVTTGHGAGPLNHSFSPLPMQIREC